MSLPWRVLSCMRIMSVEGRSISYLSNSSKSDNDDDVIDNNSSSIKSLWDDILIEILCRLDAVKTILMCTIFSKH